MPQPRRYMLRKYAAGSTPSDPPVVVSHEFQPEEDVGLEELEGRLKVTTERTWDIEVPHLQTDFAPKRFACMANPHDQCGPLLREQVPVATGNDYDSLMAAFNKRCNTLHRDDLEDEEYSLAFDLVQQMDVSRLAPWDENDVDRQRWLNKFDSGKRSRMESAMHEVPDTSYAHMGTKDISVKAEILLKRNDPGWAPRVIYAGNDVFNAVTGPAMMVAMERLNSVFAASPIGGVQFLTAYKKSDVELAGFITSNPALKHIAEGDYSANDKEQRKRVHLLFNAYLTRIKMPSWLTTILSKINTFKVQSRTMGLTATLSNQLPTGTTSTTVRNSLYNALMFAVSMVKQRITGSALILGDDLLAALDKPPDLRAWVESVARFKMKLKAKAPTSWGEATFLSRRLVVDDVETPCMVPLLGKAIARFNARGTWRADKTHSQYMAGKALSYSYEFRHVPFLRDFFLERFSMEDQSALSLDDLTWHAKTSSVDIGNIAQSIINEPVLVSEGQFRDWAMEVYDLGLVDLESICEAVICSDDPVILDHPAAYYLSKDW